VAAVLDVAGSAARFDRFFARTFRTVVMQPGGLRGIGSVVVAEIHHGQQLLVISAADAPEEPVRHRQR
jgi:hypothetical protein